jgi:hypothetical protein
VSAIVFQDVPDHHVGDERDDIAADAVDLRTDRRVSSVTQ